MKYSQLLHVLRAAAEISGEKSFVLVGSQVVVLALEEADELLTLSDELDLYPSMAPEKSDQIDGAIGALSRFHDEFGYHADGVSPETAVMPAGRDKDADFVRVLLRDRQIVFETLTQRIRALDSERYPVDQIVAWATRRNREAQESNSP